MVPKLIHFVWVNPPLPRLVRFVIQRWRGLNPDWQIMMHEKPVSEGSIASLYDRAKAKVQKADLVRLDVLNQYGGWYFDTDVIPLAPLSEFEPWEPSPGRIAAPWQNDKRLCNDALCMRANDEGFLPVMDELHEEHMWGSKWSRSHFGPALVHRHHDRGGVEPIPHQIVHPWGTHVSAVEAFAAYLEGTDAMDAHWAEHGKEKPLAFHLWGHRSQRLKELGYD